MSVYVIAQSTIEDRAKLDEYTGKAFPTIQSSGGKVVGYDESPELVEGDNEHPRTVILQFDSKEQFQKWYDSPDYQAALPLRLESTSGRMIVVNGLD